LEKHEEGDLVIHQVLVTGGAGFIGSHFIRHLLRKYAYTVVNLDALEYSGNPDNLADLSDHPNYTFVYGNICDAVIVEQVIQRYDFDAVINFAALTHVDRSIFEPGSFVQTDVYGTSILLDAARRHRRVKRFVQVSTDEVYGSVENGSSKETDALDPRSPYSASKAAADLIARAYFTTFGLPVIISRASNTFGSFQYPEKLIPFFITNAIDNEPLPLYGDGLYTRDWLHVSDHCEGLDVLLHKGEPGEIYNLGGGNERRNLEIATMILEVLGKPVSLLQHVDDRPGHDRRYSLDCSKVHGLGWSPLKRFEDGLQATVQWYQQNESWWRKIRKGELISHYQETYGRRLRPGLSRGVDR
jgi:dTDP-glucose 4,6-dehydratase